MAPTVCAPAVEDAKAVRQRKRGMTARGDGAAGGTGTLTATGGEKKLIIYLYFLFGLISFIYRDCTTCLCIDEENMNV